jgi:hypothetical protein
MWDHMCLWSDWYKYYYCMIKFASNFRSNTNLEPTWLETWWKKFGLNPSAIQPDVLDVEQMFHHLNLSNNVHHLSQISDTGYMTSFINEKHPWVIRTKYVLQQKEYSDEDPMMVRIYVGLNKFSYGDTTFPRLNATPNLSWPSITF